MILNRFPFAFLGTWLFVVLTMAPLACSFEGSDDTAPDTQDLQLTSRQLEIEEALEIIKNIKEDIALGHMLTDSPDREKQAFLDTIEQIRAALGQLLLHPQIEEYVDVVRAKTEQLRDQPVYLQDQRYVSSLLETLDQVLSAKSSKLRELFAATFDNSLDDFQQINTVGKAKWNAAANTTYIKITAYNAGANDNWLISPRFDLRSVKDPVFFIRQAVGFLQDWKALNIYIGQDYKGDDPTTFDWQPLTINQKPAVEPSRWQWVSSEDLDLSPYQNKPLVIAFRFQSTADHEPTWELEGLTIKGQGDLIQTPWSFIKIPVAAEPQPATPPPKPQPAPAKPEPAPAPPSSDPSAPPAQPSTRTALFTEGFTTEAHSFWQFNEQGKALWLWLEKDQYMKMTGFNAGANKNWLISPQFDLTDAQSVGFTIKQKWGFFDENVKANFKVMATIDGVTDQPADAHWTELTLTNLPQFKEGQVKFTDWYSSDELMLNQVEGLSGAEQVTFALVYSNETSFPQWQVDEVILTGVGSLTWQRSPGAPSERVQP